MMGVSVLRGGWLAHRKGREQGTFGVPDQLQSALGAVPWLLRVPEPQWLSRLESEANVEGAYLLAELPRRPWMLSLPAAVVEALGRQISAEAADTLKNLQSAGVDVRDWVDLGAYLTEHDALQPVLVETISEIRRHFSDAPLSAELYRDPEIPNHRYPIIYIHVADLQDRYFAALDQIGLALDRMLANKSGWLAVDLKATG